MARNISGKIGDGTKYLELICQNADIRENSPLNYRNSKDILVDKKPSEGRGHGFESLRVRQSIY